MDRVIVAGAAAERPDRFPTPRAARSQCQLLLFESGKEKSIKPRTSVESYATATVIVPS